MKIKLSELRKLVVESAVDEIGFSLREKDLDKKLEELASKMREGKSSSIDETSEAIRKLSETYSVSASKIIESLRSKIKE